MVHSLPHPQNTVQYGQSTMHRLCPITAGASTLAISPPLHKGLFSLGSQDRDRILFHTVHKVYLALGAKIGFSSQNNEKVMSLWIILTRMCLLSGVPGSLTVNSPGSLNSLEVASELYTALCPRLYNVHCTSTRCLDLDKLHIFGKSTKRAAPSGVC